MFHCVRKTGKKLAQIYSDVKEFTFILCLPDYTVKYVFLID